MNTTGSDPADTRGQPQRVLQGKSTDRATLAAIARRAMIERGLEPDFQPAARQELAATGGPAGATDGVRDYFDTPDRTGAWSRASQLPRRAHRPGRPPQVHRRLAGLSVSMITLTVLI